MKTIKQLADEIGVSKQAVYRYIKKHIRSTSDDTDVIQLDSDIEKQIKEHFQKKEPHQKSTSDVVDRYTFDAVLKQLEVKDLQIAELQKALDQEQKLHMATKQEMKLLEPPKRRWPWSRREK